MLPKKELNIYPKTEENLNALILFYFSRYDLLLGNVDKYLMNTTSLTLNQLEFIIKKLSESYELLFEPFFKNQKTTATNLILYGIEALTVNEENWKGSKARLAKTKEFLEYIKRTEKDYSYLEKYN